MSKVKRDKGVEDYYLNKLLKLLDKVVVFRGLSSSETRFQVLGHRYGGLECFKKEISRLEKELANYKQTSSMKKKSGETSIPSQSKKVRSSEPSEEVTFGTQQHLVKKKERDDASKEIGVQMNNEQPGPSRRSGRLVGKKQNYVYNEEDVHDKDSNEIDKDRDNDDSYSETDDDNESDKSSDGEVGDDEACDEISGRDDDPNEESFEMDYEETDFDFKNHDSNYFLKEFEDGEVLDYLEEDEQNFVTNSNEANSTRSVNDDIHKDQTKNASIAAKGLKVNRKWERRFCQLCKPTKLLFNDKESYQLHLYESHKDECDPCEECNFELFPDIIRHHKMHHCGRDLRCSFCVYTASLTVEVGSHIGKYHRQLIGILEPDEKLAVTSENDISGQDIVKAMKDYFEQPLVENGRYCIISFKKYALYYDKELKAPLICMEILNHSNLDTTPRTPLQRPPFFLYERLGHRQNTDQGIHYQRYKCGHVAAAANHVSDQEAYTETFALCNIVPLYHSFNSGMLRSVERHSRRLATFWENVVVVTELTYDPTKSKETVGCYMLNVPEKITKTIHVSRTGSDPQTQVFILNHFDQKISDNINIFRPPNRSTIEDVAQVTGRARKKTDGILYSWDFKGEVFYCTKESCKKCYVSQKSLDRHVLADHHTIKRKHWNSRISTQTKQPRSDSSTDIVTPDKVQHSVKTAEKGRPTRIVDNASVIQADDADRVISGAASSEQHDIVLRQRGTCNSVSTKIDIDIYMQRNSDGDGRRSKSSNVWRNRACSLCPKSTFIFVDKTSYQNHLDELHRDVCRVCENCNFEWVPNIYQHYTVHHSGRDLRCPFCSDSVSSGRRILDHLSKAHRQLIGLIEPDDKFTVNSENDIAGQDIVKVMKDYFDQPLVENDRYCIISFKKYALYYDKELRAPLICVEILTHSECDVKLNTEKKTPPFHKYQPLGYKQATVKGIHYLKYDCGHVAAAANNISDQQAYNESFALCNIVPLYTSFIQGMLSDVENHAMTLTKFWEKVVVITELTYDPTKSNETVGCYMLNVPEKITKTIHMSRTGSDTQTQAFVLKHIDEKVSDNINIFRPPNRSTIEEVAQVTRRARNKMDEILYSWDFKGEVFYCTKENCWKCYASLESLIRHISEDHKFKQCRYCSENFIKKEDLCNHLESKHGRFMCFFCEELSPTNSNLARHITLHTDVKVFSCNFCPKNYVTKEKLIKHFKEHMMEKTYLTELEKVKNLNRTEEILKSINKLDPTASATLFIGNLHESICKEILFSEFEEFGKIIMLHIFSNKDGPSMKLAFIQFESKEIGCRARRHRNGMKLYDRMMVVSYYTKATLELPMTEFSSLAKKRHYICHICDYDSNKSGNMQYHVNLHLGYRPFMCDECGYASARKASLLEHKEKMHKSSRTDNKI